MEKSSLQNKIENKFQTKLLWYNITEISKTDSDNIQHNITDIVRKKDAVISPEMENKFRQKRRWKKFQTRLLCYCLAEKDWKSSRQSSGKVAWWLDVWLVGRELLCSLHKSALLGQNTFSTGLFWKQQRILKGWISLQGRQTLTHISVLAYHVQSKKGLCVHLGSNCFGPKNVDQISFSKWAWAGRFNLQ